MTTAHTPEPWGFGFLEEGCVCEKNGGGLVIHRSLDPEEGRRQFGRADLARIIACVNALAGIADPAEFVKSRADLLAACKRALQDAIDRDDTKDEDGREMNHIECLRSAISRAEGAQS